MINPNFYVKTFFVFLAAFVGSGSAFAKGSCQETDLRYQLGPVTDQLDTGWCHSVTTADLLSAKLGYKVSGADIARNYYPNRGLFMKAVDAIGGKSEKAYSGTSYGALHSAIRAGICSDKFFPFDLAGKHVGTSVETVMKEMCDGARVGLKGYFSVDSRTTAFGDGQAEAAIQEQLSKSNIVAIDFNAYAIMRPESKDRYPLGLKGHASSVVAMRPGPQGDCEYLVRGSWGSSCRPYDKRFNCEDGNVWVPGPTLSYMVFGVNWLERAR